MIMYMGSSDRVQMMRSCTDKFNEIVLIWKTEQKKCIGNKVLSILRNKQILNTDMERIIELFINDDGNE